MQSNQYPFHMAHLRAVPGRLRLNIPVVRACRDAASEIASLLERQPGVHSVTANSRTGNVLVSFDEAIRTHDDLLSLLVSEGHVERHIHPDA